MVGLCKEHTSEAIKEHQAPIPPTPPSSTSQSPTTLVGLYPTPCITSRQASLSFAVRNPDYPFSKHLSTCLAPTPQVYPSGKSLQLPRSLPAPLSRSVVVVVGAPGGISGSTPEGPSVFFLIASYNCCPHSCPLTRPTQLSAKSPEQASRGPSWTCDRSLVKNERLDQINPFSSERTGGHAGQTRRTPR